MSKSTGFYHLTEARELRGLSVRELAEAIGVTRQSVSKYENGLQTPSADIQQAIVLKLQMPYTFFQQSQGIDSFADRPVFFRDMKTNLETKRKMAYRWLQLLCKHTRYLEEYLSLDQVNLPYIDIQSVLSISDTEIDVIAESLRSFWGLGNGPISNLTKLLENNGFIIFRKYLEAEKMDACSVVKNDRPYLLVNTFKQTCSRDLMNLAHELGHVILHKTISVEELKDKETFELIEHQAWRFAQAFLMPPSVFIPEVGYPTLSQFKKLKLRWRISMAAMIMYCRDFGIIDEAKCQYFYREMARQGIRRQEPYDDDLEVEKSSVLLECEQVLAFEGIKNHQEMLEDSCLNEKDYCELIAAPEDYFTAKPKRTKITIISDITGETRTLKQMIQKEKKADTHNQEQSKHGEKTIKIRLVARQRIINISTGKPMTDQELGYLNGIIYGPIKEVKADRITHEIAEKIISDFEKSNPDFINATYTIEEIIENPSQNPLSTQVVQ